MVLQPKDFLAILLTLQIFISHIHACCDAFSSINSCRPNRCHITSVPFAWTLWNRPISWQRPEDILCVQYSSTVFAGAVLLCSDQRSRKLSCIIWDFSLNIMILQMSKCFSFPVPLGIWKHLSLNGPLVHLQAISSESQKELGHLTIHGHSQQGGRQRSGSGKVGFITNYSKGSMNWLANTRLCATNQSIQTCYRLR